MEQKTKQQMNEKKIPGIVKIIIALFIAGMVIGILTGYFMKSSLYSPLITIYKDILESSNPQLEMISFLYLL